MLSFKIEESFNELNGMVEFELYEKATIGYISMLILSFPIKKVKLNLLLKTN